MSIPQGIATRITGSCQICKDSKALQIFFIALAFRLFTLVLLFVTSSYSPEKMAHWYDGDCYLEIAKSFPQPYVFPEAHKISRYYPLLPAFIYLASVVFRDLIFSAYLVVVLFSSLSASVFYKIASKYTSNAYCLAIIFSFFPPKWSQVSILVFSEPVFLSFLLTGIYLFMEKRYLGAFLCFGLLNLARPVGVIFLFSIFIYVLCFERSRLLPLLPYFAASTIPFFLFHGYLYLIQNQSQLLAHTGEHGGWGGSVFSFPLAGMISSFVDTKLPLTRKWYTFGIFTFYSAAFIVSLFSFKDARLRLLSVTYIIYFLFCTLLKGESYNWWAISTPRFLLPLAPIALLLILKNAPPIILKTAAPISAISGLGYVIGSYYLALKFKDILPL